jgi:hypothetical protein
MQQFNTVASVCSQNKSCVFVSHIVESVIRIYIKFCLKLEKVCKCNIHNAL